MESVVNWSETPIFDYLNFNKNAANQLKRIDLDRFQQINEESWDQRLYTEKQIDQLILDIKTNSDDFLENDVQGPIYLKALVTLRYLFNEQALNSDKFQKVRQLYGDISIENTLKLLIRCKILFGSRYALLDLFQRVFRYENDIEQKSPYLKTLESAEKVVIKGEQIKGS